MYFGSNSEHHTKILNAAVNPPFDRENWLFMCVNFLKAYFYPDLSSIFRAVVSNSAGERPVANSVEARLGAPRLASLRSVSSSSEFGQQSGVVHINRHYPHQTLIHIDMFVQSFYLLRFLSSLSRFQKHRFILYFEYGNGKHLINL